MSELADYQALVPAHYQLQKILGSGGFGVTLQALDTRSQQLCVLKMLSLQRARDWKSVELFERETQLLKHLKHPAIPRFYEAFQNEQGEQSCFFLVQELLPGQSLQQWVQAGRRFTSQAMLELLQQWAEVLAYLQAFQPPIIHRDVKPSNLMISPTGQAFLIDFGAVRDTLLQEGVRASTVVGTFGYMPLEQYEGRAQPASDLYGLGMSVIFGLSGMEPTQMAKKGLKVDFQRYLKLPKGFARILERMIEPELEKRYRSAEQLLADIQRLQRKTGPLPTATGLMAGRLSGQFQPLWQSWFQAFARWPLWLRLLLPLAALAILIGLGSLWLRPAVTQPSPIAVVTLPPGQQQTDALSDFPAPWKPLPFSLKQNPYDFVSLLAMQALPEPQQLWLMSYNRLFMANDRLQSWQAEQLFGQQASLQRLSVGAEQVAVLGRLESDKSFQLARWINGEWSLLPTPATAQEAEALAVEGQNLWLAQGDFVWYYHAGKGEWQQRAKHPERDFRRIALSPEGTWLADLNHLWLLTPVGQLQQRLYVKALVHQLFVDREGLTWVATEQGLYAYHPQTRKAQQHLPAEKVLTVTQDAQGRIWAGTADQGLFVKAGEHWLKWGYDKGLPDPKVKALAVSQGQLWMLLNEGTQARTPHVAESQQVFQAMQALKAPVALPARLYADACQAAQAEKLTHSGQVATSLYRQKPYVFFQGQLICPGGSVFLSAQGQLIFEQDHKLVVRGEQQLYAVPLPYAGYASLYDVLYAGQGQLWLSSSKGLYHFDGQRWLTLSDKGQALFAESEGQVYLGGRSSSLPMLQVSRGGKLQNISPLEKSYPPTVYGISGLGKAGLALATTDGLWFRQQAGDFEVLKREHGLKTDFVHALAADPQGIWLAPYHQGLTYYRFADQALLHWSSREGLFADHIDALALDNKGQLWLKDDRKRVAVYKISDLLASHVKLQEK